MRTNKTAVILITLLLIFAFASVFIVLYDINNKNKEDIIFSLSKNNSQFIIDASNLEILNNSFNSPTFNELTSKNIKNVDAIKNALNKIQSDSIAYSRIKDNRALIATYTNGDWIILVKTNISIKSDIDGIKGHIGNYHYISSSRFEKSILNNSNNESLSLVINSRANTSDLHIIETLSVNNEPAWACHDFYFEKNSIEILSFYSPAKRINDDISKNNSNVILSFAKNRKSYKYTYSDDKAISVLKTSYIGSFVAETPTVVDNIAEEEEVVTTSDYENQTTVSPLPESNSNIDPLALFSTEKKIIAGPFYVNNHTNQQGNIIIQDSDNIIYFLTTTGNVKWRFNADSKIIGNISELDSYNNKKIQYLFNTATRMYLLTILGDNVKGFPIKLPIHAKNQILLDFTDIDNFNLIYSGADKNAYILKYSKGDLRLNSKIENISSDEKIFDVVYSGKNKHFIVTKDDNTKVLYSFTGTPYFTIDKSYEFGENPSFFENKTNSKGSYIANDNQGRLSYISRNKQTQYTDFGKFGSENHFEYLDISGNGEPDFIFIDKDKIKAYDKFKNAIFSSDVKLNSIDNVNYKVYKNTIKIIVYSQKDNKAIVFNYNKQLKKLSKNTYTTTTCPDVTFSNSLIVENNHLYLK